MADINIYGKLVNATPDGILADSEQVKDTVQNKKQSEINSEVKSKLEELESRPQGVSDYIELTGKPQIGGIELTGNKSLSDLGIQPVGDYATKTELEGKVDDSEISDMLTKTEASSTYQPIGDYLTVIPDEYITETELTEKGYATTSQLDTKLDTSTYSIDKETFATKTELENKLDINIYNSDKETYATKSELSNKQDNLVSGTNIKTINGNSLLGSGNLEISGTGGISEAPEDGGVYGRSNRQWVTIPSGEGGTIVVDSELSDSSLNPVQNKIITSELNNIKSTSIKIKGEKASLEELLLLTDSKVGDLWVINSNFTLGGINYVSGSSVICKIDTTPESHTEDNYKSLSAVDLTGYIKEADIEGVAFCTPISSVTEILQ